MDRTKFNRLKPFIQLVFEGAYEATLAAGVVNAKMWLDRARLQAGDGNLGWQEADTKGLLPKGWNKVVLTRVGCGAFGGSYGGEVTRIVIRAAEKACDKFKDYNYLLNRNDWEFSLYNCLSIHNSIV